MVINSRIAGRYAKSLIDIALETNQLEIVKQDVDFLAAALKVSPLLGNVLRSPIIKSDKKISILREIGKGKVSDITQKFMRLLAVKGRENGLPEILNEFITQYNTLKGIHKVRITTASPISDELRTILVNKLKTDTGIPLIDLEEVVDESIIGGFIMEYDNKRLDTSITTELRDVRRQFLNNDYIYRVR